MRFVPSRLEMTSTNPYDLKREGAQINTPVRAAARPLRERAKPWYSASFRSEVTEDLGRTKGGGGVTGGVEEAGWAAFV